MTRTTTIGKTATPILKATTKRTKSQLTWKTPSPLPRKSTSSKESMFKKKKTTRVITSMRKTKTHELLPASSLTATIKRTSLTKCEKSNCISNEWWEGTMSMTKRTVEPTMKKMTCATVWNNNSKTTTKKMTKMRMGITTESCKCKYIQIWLLLHTKWVLTWTANKSKNYRSLSSSKT